MSRPSEAAPYPDESPGGFGQVHDRSVVTGLGPARGEPEPRHDVFADTGVRCSRSTTGPKKPHETSSGARRSWSNVTKAFASVRPSISQKRAMRCREDFDVAEKRRRAHEVVTLSAVDRSDERAHVGMRRTVGVAPVPACVHGPGRPFSSGEIAGERGVGAPAKPQELQPVPRTATTGPVAVAAIRPFRRAGQPSTGVRPAGPGPRAGDQAAGMEGFSSRRRLASGPSRSR